MYRLEDTYWWFVSRRRLVRALVKRFAPPRPRILDLGCGTGGTLDALAGLGDLTGADISAEALAFCRRRGHTALQECSAEALPFGEEQFDVVICCDVFEHLEHDELGAAEVLRVLRPGGVLIASVPAYQWLWSDHDVALSHHRRYSRRGLRALLVNAGAQVVKLTCAVSFVFPLVMAVRLLGHLRPRANGNPDTKLVPPPGPVNRLLIALHDLEAAIIVHAGLPWGSSLIAVARKPEAWKGGKRQGATVRDGD